MPYFRDIIAIGHKGEHNNSVSNQTDIVSRLINHIQFLMAEAKQAHLNLDTQAQQNTITRLILNEFSLYPKRPLTLAEYKIIIAALAEYASKLPSAVHIVVATLPVLWPANNSKHGIQHNVGLYIQCGISFKLHHFNKNLAFDDYDLRYGARSLYGSRHTDKKGFLIENYYDTYYAPKYILKDTAVSADDVNQSYGAIKLKIFEQEIIVLNEVCCEHDNAIGLYYVSKLIEQLHNAKQSIPEYASHVLISNTIEVQEANQIGPIAHADPNASELKNSTNKAIDKPIFGSPLTLYYLKPKEIEKMYQKNLTHADSGWGICFPLRCNMNFLEIEEINRYYIAGFNFAASVYQAIPVNELIKYLVVNNDYTTLKVYFDNGKIDLEAENNFPLRWAARLGHTEIVKLLLTLPIVEPEVGGNYAFRWACANGHTEIVEILLRNNRVNPDAGTYNGLALACLNNQTAIARLLLKDARVDPYATKNEAFLFAIQNGNLEIVKLFYEKGVSVCNSNQLRSALKKGYLDVIKFVLGDAKDWPLYELKHMCVVAKKHSSVVDYLQDIINTKNANKQVKKQNKSFFFQPIAENKSNTNLDHSVNKPKKKKASRIVIHLSSYQYVPRKSLPKDIDGFATNNVCESVCGFITSDQGFAFFHLFQYCDADCLAEYAAKDFANATNIKVILFGGNPGMFYFPWRSDKREVMFSALKPRDRVYGRETEVDPNAPDLKTGEEALQQIKLTLENNPNGLRHFNFHRKHDISQPDEKDIAACINTYKDNVISYSIEKLNAMLNPKGKFLLVKTDAQFIVHDMKDMQGYQNVARVSQALTQYPRLFNQDNIIHHNTINNAEVLADFSDGSCHIYTAKWDNGVKNDIVELDYNEVKLNDSSIQKIKDAGKIPELNSLSEQGIKSGFIDTEAQLNAKNMFNFLT